MASVLFSTVGQGIGGPAGATIGALAGSAVDGAVAGGGTARAIEDLVPRASYGAAIPRLYGRARVAGTLIWALPMTRSGGGRAGGQRRYATSFAIALSSRPIVGVGRIWADGREIRDANGIDAFAMTMRVHDGRRAAAVDPALAAAEGVDAPAHAHLAHVVFENFALGLFGNRIPALSFEVIASEPSAGPDRWLADLSVEAGIAAEEGGARLAKGLVAGSDTHRRDAETLALAADLWSGTSAGRARWRRPAATVVVPIDALVADDGGQDGAGFSSEWALRPGATSIAYSDPARDYLLGEQRSSRVRPGALVSVSGGLVTTAPMARGLATRLLRRGEALAERLTLRLPWAWIGVEPGDALRLGGVAGEWRVLSRRITGLIIELECCRAVATSGAASVADPGKVVRQPALPAGATRLGLAELPMALESDRVGAGILVLAGGGLGWAGTALAWERNQSSGTLPDRRDPMLRGVLTAAIADGQGVVWDERSTAEVELDDDGLWLESRTSQGVLAGENLALIGDELVQFRTAERIGARQYRLSGLLRGRRATSARAHETGETFWIVDRPMTAVPVSGDDAGQWVVVRAAGAGDPPGGTVAQHQIHGAGQAPLAPCHVRLERLVAGEIVIRWVSRARSAFGWSAPADIGPTSCECIISPTGHADVRIRGEDGFARWPLTMQVAAVGAPVGAAWVRVIALGDGPEAVRAAAPAFLAAD